MMMMLMRNSHHNSGRFWECETSILKRDHHFSNAGEMTYLSNKRTFYYPYKLAITISILKLFNGLFLIILGALAFYQKSSYYETACGIWTGIFVMISGILGIFSVNTKASRAYVNLFLIFSLICIMCSVFVIIYSASGLALDSGYPNGFVKDKLTGERIPISTVNIKTLEGNMMVNLLLIISGIIDIILSLPSLIICLREICNCYNPVASTTGLNQSYEYGRRDWLLNWLQNQQHNHLIYNGHHHHHPGSFGMGHMPFMILPPHTPDPSIISSYKRGIRKGKSPSLSKSSIQNPPIPNVHPSHGYIYYTPPPPPPPPPQLPVHPWFLGPPIEIRKDSTSRPTPVLSSNGGRPHLNTNKSSSAKMRVEKYKKKSPTDSDLDKTYTGLDRELAEEFIEQTMDPNQMSTTSSSSDQSSQAW